MILTSCSLISYVNASETCVWSVLCTEIVSAREHKSVRFLNTYKRTLIFPSLPVDKHHCEFDVCVTVRH